MTKRARLEGGQSIADWLRAPGSPVPAAATDPEATRVCWRLIYTLPSGAVVRISIDLPPDLPDETDGEVGPPPDEFAQWG